MSSVAQIRELRETLGWLVQENAPDNVLANARERGRKLLAEDWPRPSAKVSDEAVEAAARVIFGMSIGKVCREITRDALTAALPHLTAYVGERWRPIAQAPKDGGYIVTNRARQVAFCDVYSGQRLVHNVPGFIEWDWDKPATHWMPLPAAPTPEANRG